jgi:DNA polymerase-3 subunit gamma/tau
VGTGDLADPKPRLQASVLLPEGRGDGESDARAVGRELDFARSLAALYRKYRPQDFDEVVGQEPVVRTLKNAISAGQLRQAYLFAGPRGTGKTSMARILAKGLNCEQGPTPNPDKVCSACVSIANGSSLDVIEMDAASQRGIDDIREIR